MFTHLDLEDKSSPGEIIIFHKQLLYTGQCSKHLTCVNSFIPTTQQGGRVLIDVAIETQRFVPKSHSK